MRRPFIVCCLATLPLSLVAQSPLSNVELRARVDSFVSSRMAEDVFSGAVLVARGGQMVYQRAVGVANREINATNSIDTRFQIASTSKLFTNIAIRQLEQAGKLALSDTVGRFLPDYPNAVVRSRVTVEQLLRHRSGVGSFWNAKFMERRASLRTVRDYLELFQDDSLLFEPGSGEAYSNGGYVILGAIIERVSGQTYHEYLRDHVFGPAGMTQTAPYDSRVLLAKAAVGYTRMAEGPVAGDQRMAGAAGPRPGYEVREGSAGAAPGMQLRIRDANGRELSPDEARAAMARRGASDAPRRANTGFQAGMSSPAGDHFSTVGDVLRLANALVSHRLLDSTHTAALFGQRYAGGSDFRANGGGPGVNAELSIYPTGEVVVVLSNYDPPSATQVAQFIRSLVTRTARP